MCVLWRLTMLKWLKNAWPWSSENPNDAIWPKDFKANDVKAALDKQALRTAREARLEALLAEDKPRKPTLKKATTMATGLYANIHAKQERIKKEKAEGKPVEKMRKPGTKGAPTAAAFKQSAKTAKKK